VSKPSSVLDDIVAAYGLERDLLKVARRAIRVSEMTVMAVWIEFERFLIAHILLQVNVVKSALASFDLKLSEHVERQIEFSRMDDLLDLYRGSIDSSDLGLLKQIKDYRDWISHRNPKRPTPASVDPVRARAILGDVMDRLA